MQYEEIICQSEDVPFTCSFVCYHHLVASSSDFGILVIIEFWQSFVYLLFQMFRTTITDNMKNSLSNSNIGVISHLEDSFPENFNVFLNLAWTQLLASFKPNIIIFRSGIFEDSIDILCVSTDVKDLFLWLLTTLNKLLLIIPALTHLNIIKFLVSSAISY